MKEATGDLNMTVVIVIIVALLVAFFSGPIRNTIMGGIRKEANCQDAICPCEHHTDNDTTCDDCYLKGSPGAKFSCPFKG